MKLVLNGYDSDEGQSVLLCGARRDGRDLSDEGISVLSDIFGTWRHVSDRYTFCRIEFFLDENVYNFEESIASLSIKAKAHFHEFPNDNHILCFRENRIPMTFKKIVSELDKTRLMDDE